MNTRSPEGNPASTTIVVEVPHWTAAVSLLDNDLRPVETGARVTPVSGDAFLGRVEFPVESGTYEVQVTLDGKTQTKWIIADGEEPVNLGFETWNKLTIETAMPLPGAAPSASSSDEVAELATERVPVAPTKASRITLFGTAVAGPDEPARDFDFDVKILDGKGAIVADLSSPTAPPSRVEPRRFWRWPVDLEPGYYTLRTRVSEPRAAARGRTMFRYQPLFLCPGIENHLFFRCDGPPDLATMTMHVTRLGESYDPHCAEAVAADAVLTALNAGDARRVLLGSERLEQMLHGETANPWLAVLSAYALLSPESGARSAVQSVEASTDIQALLDEILDFLEHGPLRDHPDVRILLLRDSSQPTPAVDYPPMLRLALRRLHLTATERAGLIAPGSPIEHLANRLIADSPWVSWTEEAEGQTQAVASQLTEPAADSELPPPIPTFVEAFPDSAPSELPPPIPTFVEAFPDSAPVYPLVASERIDGEQAVQEGATLAVHAAIIKAASEVLSTSCRSADPVTVPLQNKQQQVLDLSPLQVSRLTGVPLDIVTQDLESLKRAQPTDAGRADLRRPLALLGAAILGMQAKAAVDHFDDDNDDPIHSLTPIESKVGKLEAEAARLTALANRSEADPLASRLRSLATRFTESARALVKRAHLIIVADDQGRLRYVNRLLRDRLEVREGGAAAVIARMAKLFAALESDCTIVSAADLSPTSPEARADTDVEVRRKRLVDVGGSAIGSIYLLRDVSVPELTVPDAHRLDILLPQVTLFASLSEIAQGDERISRLGELEILASKIEEVLQLL